MMNNSDLHGRISQTCPRCHTLIEVLYLSSDLLIDPCPPPHLPFVIKHCPKCGKRVFFWIGGKHIVEG